jgi:hypothetical protein
MSVRLRDLNTVEWHTLIRLGRGVPDLNFNDEALARLLDLGLAERRSGGFGISAVGQSLISPVKARAAQR